MAVEFDWNQHNSDHIARHCVSPQEAEDALTDPDRLAVPAYKGSDGEPRWAVVGSTKTGRILSVVFTLRGTKCRVVTAYEAPSKLKNRYWA